MTEIAQPDLTAQEARILTDQIRDDVSMLLPQIREAYTRHADLALGYPSWEKYCDAELSNLRLPLPQRRQLEIELRKDGMSNQQISAAVGVDRRTVDRDFQAPGTPPRTPAPTGVPANQDGKDEEIQARLAEGKSYAAIAEDLHVSKGRIARVAYDLDEVGVPPGDTPAGVDPQVYEAAQRNKRIIDLHGAGKGHQEIADLLEIARSTVQRVLKRHQGEGPSPASPTISRDATASTGRRMDMARLAARGHTSAQIAKALGYANETTVRAAAATWGIDLAADKVMAHRVRPHDSTRILKETASQLDGMKMSLSFVDVASVSRDDLPGLVEEFQQAAREINRWIKQLKGMIDNG